MSSPFVSTSVYSRSHGPYGAKASLRRSQPFTSSASPASSAVLNQSKSLASMRLTGGDAGWRSASSSSFASPPARSSSSFSDSKPSILNMTDVINSRMERSIRVNSERDRRTVAVPSRMQRAASAGTFRKPELKPKIRSPAHTSHPLVRKTSFSKTAPAAMSPLKLNPASLTGTQSSSPTKSLAPLSNAASPAPAPAPAPATVTSTMPGYTGFIRGLQLVAGRPYGKAVRRAHDKPPERLVLGETIPASPQCTRKIRAPNSSYDGMIPGYTGFVPKARDMIGVTYGVSSSLSPVSTHKGLQHKDSRLTWNRSMFDHK